MKIERLFDLLLRYVSHFPSEDTFCFKKHGLWKKYGIEEAIESIDALSKGLLQFGLKKGDKIAIISNNRPEWNFVDFACQQIGVITIPFFTSFSESEIRNIVEETDVRLIFAGDRESAGKCNNALNGIDDLCFIYTFDYVGGFRHWSELKDFAEEYGQETLASIKENISKDDVVSIIYTSGATGKPKGVMLSHHNILSNLLALSQAIPLEPGDQYKVLSFLPLSHIFERSAVYSYLYFGCCIYYAETLESVQENLQEIRPFTFTVVPRMLEKFYLQIIRQGQSFKGVKRKVFVWSLNLAFKYEANAKKDFWYKIRHFLADQLVYKNWRKLFGGQLKYIISGAASLQPRLSRLFWASKIMVLEGYGLTETAPAIAFTNAKDPVFGTVGRPLEGVSVKIAEDGEILVKGPNVMRGYFNNQKLTSEVIRKDGWFHTGDLGKFDANGCLKVTGRKKELFKNAEGFIIAPQELEEKLMESDLIEQIMIVGENEKYPSALIVPGKEAVLKLCKDHKIPYTSLPEVLQRPEVKQKFDYEIQKHNSSLNSFERIRKFLVIPESWGITTGELTPTLKMKRSYIQQKYQEQIAMLYKKNVEDSSQFLI